MLDHQVSRDRVFAALAEPHRREIVERLARGPVSVSELARPLPLSLAAVVQHVQVLEASGLVRSEKVGRVRTCWLSTAGLRTAEEWLRHQHGAWERSLDRLGDYLALPPDPTPGRNGMPVLHSTFRLERTYPAAPERVFAAWAEPSAKARWFAGAGTEHHLDFRAGGSERVVRPGDPALRFDSAYHDIVPGRRIVYSATLHADNQLATVSLTTAEFGPAAGGTLLVLTEQGTYLDGRESPALREQGTAAWLDALATHL